MAVSQLKQEMPDIRFEHDLKSIRAQLQALCIQAGHLDLEFLAYLIDMALQEALECTQGTRTG